MSVLATPPDDNTRASLIVDLDAIAANYARLQTMASGSETAAVVKADAYGLGMPPIARRLLREGARTFFVATVEEGVALRQALNDPAPDIWVFNGFRGQDRPQYLQYKLGAVINQTGELAQIKAGTPPPCALHLDTGMGRLGVAASDLASLLPSLSALDVRLVMSHLACSEEADSPYNAQQLERFTTLAQTLDHALPEARLSLANTGGVMLGHDYHFDLVRPGIGLYGATAGEAQNNIFEPAAVLRAPILQLRALHPGDTVGYGASYVADRPRIAATLAVGYADGLPRALSRAGCARIDGRPAPVLGRVSMDLTVIDVTGLESLIAQGAVPEFLGADLYETAHLDGTLPYEVLTGLGDRAERVYQGRSL